MLLPHWLAPLVIFASRTIRVDADRISGETWRRRVELDLSEVCRIWLRRTPAKNGDYILIGFHTHSRRRLFLWLHEHKISTLGDTELTDGFEVGPGAVQPTALAAKPVALQSTVLGHSCEAAIGVLLADLARRPGVTVSPRVQAFLRLPGGPTHGDRVLLWLRGLVLFLAITVAFAYSFAGYYELAMSL